MHLFINEMVKFKDKNLTKRSQYYALANILDKVQSLRVLFDFQEPVLVCITQPIMKQRWINTWGFKSL